MLAALSNQGSLQTSDVEANWHSRTVGPQFAKVVGDGTSIVWLRSTGGDLYTFDTTTSQLNSVKSGSLRNIDLTVRQSKVFLLKEDGSICSSNVPQSACVKPSFLAKLITATDSNIFAITEGGKLYSTRLPFTTSSNFFDTGFTSPDPKYLTVPLDSNAPVLLDSGGQIVSSFCNQQTIHCFDPPSTSPQIPSNPNDPNSNPTTPSTPSDPNSIPQNPIPSPNPQTQAQPAFPGSPSTPQNQSTATDLPVVNPSDNTGNPSTNPSGNPSIPGRSPIPTSASASSPPATESRFPVTIVAISVSAAFVAGMVGSILVVFFLRQRYRKGRDSSRADKEVPRNLVPSRHIQTRTTVARSPRLEAISLDRPAGSIPEMTPAASRSPAIHRITAARSDTQYTNNSSDTGSEYGSSEAIPRSGQVYMTTTGVHIGYGMDENDDDERQDQGFEQHGKDRDDKNDQKSLGSPASKKRDRDSDSESRQNDSHSYEDNEGLQSDDVEDLISEDDQEALEVRVHTDFLVETLDLPPVYRDAEDGGDD
ncbi:hypothetical protein HDU97_007223 [Phlyctochytrium planicorne]|nr:hypothetical protein HDU97_007223 [Phlyctochytrium planicorne]